MRLCMLFTVSLALSALGFSATIYVPDDFSRIQDAITASSNGDSIIVRPGLYAENIDFGPGGIPKAIELMSEKGPGVTIIDGTQSGSVAFVSNNTLYGNKASGQGGGIYVLNSGCAIRNTIVWGNSAPVGPEIDSSSVTVEYCDVKGGWPGKGNIDADPLFVDPAKNDLHLYYSSPCRDAGDNAATNGNCDFEFDPRIANGTVDMGADEFHRHLYTTGPAVPGGPIQLKLVGLPGSTPVGLFVGSGILSWPVNTIWGDFYLEYPWFLIVLPVTIPGSGVLVLSATVPGSPPAPYDIPLQAMIGDAFSNFWVVEVR